MSKSNLVTKSNELIEARYKLTLYQQRLILLLISIIQPDDDDFIEYELHVSEFAEMFGIEKTGDVYFKVEEAARLLVTKGLDLSVGDNRKYIAWLSKVEYTKGQGVLKISFHKSLKPYLLQLKSHFTQYNIRYIVKFRSQYSIRLYELLKSYEYLGDGGCFYREFHVVELRMFFGIDETEYQKFGHLKLRVIEPSVKDINLHSDIFVSSVEYLKEKREIKRVKFSVEPKGNTVVVKPLSLIDCSTDASIALLNYGIADVTIKKWIKEYGDENILNACRFVHSKQEAGQVKDAPAYLAMALKERYYVAWLEAENKKEAKRAATQAKKAEQEENERNAREAVRLRVDAVLEAFHARPDLEQAGLRTMFWNTTSPITAKSWKKFMATEPQPENMVRFRFEFADFLKNYKFA